MRGCIQPMSSPMMKRMLGLLAGACAIAGKHNPNKATPETSRLPIRLLIFMFEILRCGNFLIGYWAASSDWQCRARQQVVALRRRPPPRLSASYRSGDFLQVALHALCDFGRFMFFDRFSSDR